MKAKILIVITALTISAIPAYAEDNCDDGFCNAEVNATTGVVTKTRLSDAEIQAILDKRALSVPNLPNNTSVSSDVTPSGLPFNPPEDNPLWLSQNAQTVTPNVETPTVSETTTVTETITATVTNTTTATITSVTVETLYAQIMALLNQVLALIAKLNR